jgi:RNA polymerase sigma-70 factor (ECF subfamily)
VANKGIGGAAGPSHKETPRIDRAASPSTELRLLDGLRDGDEDAFGHLIDLYGASLLRVAMMYVPSRAVAEEVVQETWLGLLESLDRFEGRASLKTWIFRILLNSAKKRGAKERRQVPFSAVWDSSQEGTEPSVDPERFLGPGHTWAGHWQRPPKPVDELPEERLLAREVHARLGEVINSLPPAQREVVTLRDVEGWTSSEVCNAVGVSETNQRVLLHRARTKVRRALEEYLDEDQE